VGIEELVQAVNQYHLLVLDTMVFSHHLGGHPRYSPLTRAILTAVESGQVEGLTTTITLSELLTRPAQANDQQAMQDYELYITRFPNLQLVPLDASLARETARVRAETRLRMPDAVQIAAARLYQADAIVTNDRRWLNRVHRPDLIMLDEYT
jgi:predicted nucleic acid-binding protein